MYRYSGHSILAWILIDLPSILAPLATTPISPHPWRLYIQEINKARKLAKEKEETQDEEQQPARRAAPRKQRKRRAAPPDPDQVAEEPEDDPAAPAPKRRVRRKGAA